MSAPVQGASAQGAHVPLPVLDRPQVPSWRLLVTLGGAGALAGLLIVLVFGWTQPRIEAHRALVLRTAIAEVLRAPARADTLWLHEGRLVEAVPAGADGAKLERVYRGHDASGRVTGYAITASKAGFADQISVIFGYDPSTKQLLAMKVLGSKETPGLGDKIERPAFLDQFKGRVAPLEGVKDKPGDTHDVVMITGATISSRTIIAEINDAVVRWQPLLDAERGRATAAAAPGRP